MEFLKGDFVYFHFPFPTMNLKDEITEDWCWPFTLTTWGGLNASSKPSSPSSVVNQKEGLIIFTSYLTEPELA